MKAAPSRVATVLTERSAEPPADARLATALLAGSPRVARVGPGACRVDARGWERCGGEMALTRALGKGAAEAGFTVSGIGVGDVAVVADAAALLIRKLRGREEGAMTLPGMAAAQDGTIIVAPRAGAAFLAPLPLSFLPLPEEMREILRALGFRRIGDLATRDRSELESRFGPAGVRAHRLSRAEDDRAFWPLEVDDLPQASLELDGPADALEPLLFVLRHLLHRICADLLNLGQCATRLSLELRLEGRHTPRRARILPARPTRRENLLYDLCRASLERAVGREGLLDSPVLEVTLRVERVAAPGTRQGDLFTSDWRDPMAAAAALSRLRARLGDDVVAWPHPRAVHRPEARSRWRPVSSVETAEEDRPRSVHPVSGKSVLDSVLHLLPEPVEVEVRTVEGCLVELRDSSGPHPLIVAEGPERISGEWWKNPYRREYYRACTRAGELLWLFRERLRWWLHGYWD